MIGILFVFAVVFVVGTAVFFGRALRAARRASRIERPVSQLTDEAPETLHPVIDPSVCIGSGACVRACPEKRALILVGGRARLADAGGCVGHGACRDACPVEAITLVFGGERRGVNLPNLDETFQTNVPGLYIAGELGGMGLVANAARQGVKCVEAIAESLDEEGPAHAEATSLVVVGAGPAGIAATLAARARGIDVRTFEREATLGGAVRTYPRRKVVMTSPVALPLYGKVRLRQTTKEALVELFEDVVARTGIHIEHGVRVEGVSPRSDGVFSVRTSVGEVLARRVLLAAGRRGQPRKVGAPGDHLPHVRFQLDDPADFVGAPCVVVGGGDSAVEAALALAEEPGTAVVLCHRRESFDRIKPGNRQRLEAAEAAGALRVMRSTRVVSISPDDVVVEEKDRNRETIPARHVLTLLGAELPKGLLESAGIRLETHFGHRVVESSPRT